MAKITNPNGKVKKVPYKVSEIYFDLLTFQEKPISENGIKTLMLKLYDWAKNDKNAYKVGPFLREHGISGRTFKRWRVGCRVQKKSN